MRIALENVTKRFRSLRGRTTALDALSLDIGDGEFFVLLGPSGCGKSTTLNLIAGLEQPTDGRIRFGDDVVAAGGRGAPAWSPKERNVAMVFQSYALYPHLSVFDNVAFPLRIAKAPAAEVEHAVREAADLLHIGDLLAARPGELSGGQRQRVAIARAIVRQPAVFLLDEPLSNLDAQLRASTRLELKRLQRRLGVTTIYVTHDQIEAINLGDRIAVLNRGRLEQVGTPDELYERPANAFVGAFIGSPEMNLLRAGVRPAGEAAELTVGGQTLLLPPERAQALLQERMNECVLGVRPEHVAVGEPGAGLGLRGRIVSIEPLGRELLVHAQVGGVTVGALTTEKALQPDTEIGLLPDLAHAHLFRPEADRSDQTRID